MSDIGTSFVVFPTQYLVGKWYICRHAVWILQTFLFSSYTKFWFAWSYNFSQFISLNAPLISLRAAVGSFLSYSDLRTLFLSRD